MGNEVDGCDGDPKSPISAASMRRRDIIRSFVLCRQKWLDVVEKSKFREWTPNKKFKRSQQTTVYFVRAGSDAEWLTRMKEEFEKLNSKLRGTEFVGSSRPRTLWTPEVVEDVSMLQRRIYVARSLGKVTIAQARDFTRGSPTKVSLPTGNLFVTSKTGNKYALHVTYQTRHEKDLPFREWSVCVCEDRHAPVVIAPDRLTRRKRVGAKPMKERTGFMSSYTIVFEKEGRLLLVANESECEPNDSWD